MPDLARVSTVDALVSALRDQILEGGLAPGARLREAELSDSYSVARHSTRAALRALAGEGLVRIEPNRGATVAALSAAEVEGLYELRTALEVEAARRALDRGGGTLPADVHEAAEHLARICRRRRPAWGDVAEAHSDVHRAIVLAGGSERIARAHEALAGETRLFLMQLRPHWSHERMASGHLELVAALEKTGPEALRRHLAESVREVLAGGETA